MCLCIYMYAFACVFGCIDVDAGIYVTVSVKVCVRADEGISRCAWGGEYSHSLHGFKD